MKLFYTNSDQALEAQKDPLISLGGFISSSPVPNDLDNNLFSDISEISRQEGQRETKAIALLNNTGADISSLSVWIEYDDIVYVDVELSFAAINQNNGSPFMERIDNLKALPFGANFEEPTVGDKLTLVDTISDGDYVGLWIKRKVKTINPIDVFPGTIANLSPEESIEINGQEYSKDHLQQGGFKIRIEYS